MACNRKPRKFEGSCYIPGDQLTLMAKYYRGANLNLNLTLYEGDLTAAQEPSYDSCWCPQLMEPGHWKHKKYGEEGPYDHDGAIRRRSSSSLSLDNTQALAPAGGRGSNQNRKESKRYGRSSNFQVKTGGPPKKNTINFSQEPNKHFEDDVSTTKSDNFVVENDSPDKIRPAHRSCSCEEGKSITCKPAPLCAEVTCSVCSRNCCGLCRSPVQDRIVNCGRVRAQQNNGTELKRTPCGDASSSMEANSMNMSLPNLLFCLMCAQIYKRLQSTGCPCTCSNITEEVPNVGKTSGSCLRDERRERCPQARSSWADPRKGIHKCSGHNDWRSSEDQYELISMPRRCDYCDGTVSAACPREKLLQQIYEETEDDTAESSESIQIPHLQTSYNPTHKINVHVGKNDCNDSPPCRGESQVRQPPKYESNEFSTLAARMPNLISNLEIIMTKLNQQAVPQRRQVNFVPNVKSPDPIYSLQCHNKERTVGMAQNVPHEACPDLSVWKHSKTGERRCNNSSASPSHSKCKCSSNLTEFSGENNHGKSSTHDRAKSSTTKVDAEAPQGLKNWEQSKRAVELMQSGDKSIPRELESLKNVEIIPEESPYIPSQTIHQMPAEISKAQGERLDCHYSMELTTAAPSASNSIGPHRVKPSMKSDGNIACGQTEYSGSRSSETPSQNQPVLSSESSTLLVEESNDFKVSTLQALCADISKETKYSKLLGDYPNELSNDSSSLEYSTPTSTSGAAVNFPTPESSEELAKGDLGCCISKILDEEAAALGQNSNQLLGSNISPTCGKLVEEIESVQVVKATGRNESDEPSECAAVRKSEERVEKLKSAYTAIHFMIQNVNDVIENVDASPTTKVREEDRERQSFFVHLTDDCPKRKYADIKGTTNPSNKGGTSLRSPQSNIYRRGPTKKVVKIRPKDGSQRVGMTETSNVSASGEEESRIPCLVDTQDSGSSGSTRFTSTLRRLLARETSSADLSIAKFGESSLRRPIQKRSWTTPQNRNAK